MGFWDRLLGRAPQLTSQQPQHTAARPAPNADEQALDRYRYLLRTAPPEAIEQAHAEAFAQLTPEQRRQVLTELGRDLAPGEQSASEDPREMARMATRAELRQPGTMERALGGGRGMGMGGLLAGSLLASVAGSVIGTSIAASFLTDEQSTGDGSGSASVDGQGTGADDASAQGSGYDGGGGFDGGGFDSGGGFGGGDFGV